MKKRRKKSDNVSNGGGENPKMSEIQIGTFETPRGVSIFQKCLNYKLLSDPILKKKN